MSASRSVDVVAVAASVVTVRVVTADVMLARARRPVRQESSPPLCKFRPLGHYSGFMLIPDLAVVWAVAVVVPLRLKSFCEFLVACLHRTDNTPSHFFGSWAGQ